MNNEVPVKVDLSRSSPNTTRVLLTGISGFLGSHIAIELLNQGYQVRGTLRSTSRSAQMRDLILSNARASHDRLTFVETDLLKDNGWDQAADGVDYIIHTASPFLSYMPKHEEELIKPAVEGTKRVLECALRHKVQRVVLTSSIAAVMYGNGKSPYTELDWSDAQSNKVTPYYKSKTLAEKFAWDFASKHGLELSVINPGAILGPVLEKDYGTSAEIVVKLLKGELIGVPNIGFAMVDVRDVAQLHIQALFHPSAKGERFIAASDYLCFKEVADILADAYPAYKKVIPSRLLPSWLVKIVGRFDPAIKTILKDLDNKRVVNNGKAITQLGWHPRSSKEAVLATADSLIKQGLV